MHQPSRKSLIFVFGTRPEAIKLAPVIKAFALDGTFRVTVCVTAQHRELLDQFLTYFDIVPDIDLNLMSHNQSLPNLAARAIESCTEVYQQTTPDMVFVQGDTTSAFAAAFAASLNKIPIAHVEAGLRSYQRLAPFPEETNRVLISHLADLHFAHTSGARRNLHKEGITHNVHVVGNTVVDALQTVAQLLANDRNANAPQAFSDIDFSRPTILVTLHRRENIGWPLSSICTAIRTLADAHPKINVVFPVHPNPNIRNRVLEELGGIHNIHLRDPLPYFDFIWLLFRSTLVITDSGGVQEEASTIGLPVLVTREVTEPTEAVKSGHTRLVGSDPMTIVHHAEEMLGTPRTAANPGTNNGLFGDGNAAGRIVEITKRHLSEGSCLAS